MYHLRTQLVLLFLLGMTFLSACSSGGGGGDSSTVPSYTVGGTVTGLAADQSIVIQNNATDDLSISADGSFTFATALTDGATYNVTVLTQPTGQTCTASTNSGTVSGANVSDVAIACVTNQSIGGTFSGLATGKTITLRLNDSIEVTLDHTANGLPYTFPNGLPPGSEYVVTIVSQPLQHQCTIGNATGTASTSAVTNIDVTCVGFTVVSAGALHALGIKADGTLWAWGVNNYGQLGVGDTTDRNQPVQVGIDADWTGISAGGDHSIARKANGTLWAWGDNSFGQLGVGDIDPRLVPARLNSDTDWVDAFAGGWHTLATKSDGTLWAWGYNASGQLGMGDTEQRNSPEKIDSAIAWTLVTVGSDHNLALKADGTLWAWGDNGNGQLGLNDTTEHLAPMRVNSDTDWVTIGAGSLHTHAIKNDGSLWAWGDNSYGQLGFLDDTTNTFVVPTQVGSEMDWATVCPGRLHSLATKTDGTLWAWGANDAGQLGIGGTVASSSREQVGTDTGWVACEAGSSYTIARKADGTLWAWGDNYQGELALGLFGEYHQPTATVAETGWSSISSGENYALGIKSDGTLWAWGYNAYGRLGLGINDFLPYFVPTLVNQDTDWAAVSAGSTHVLALKTDGTLWAWGGDRGYGKLGLGDLGTNGVIPTPTQVGSFTNWAAVSAGVSHSLALKSDGTLWAWGHNGFGQLAMSDTTTNSNTPTQVSLGTGIAEDDNDWVAMSAGGYHNLAIKSDGTLWAWGRNDFGQLGLGNTAQQTEPMPVGTGTNWSAITASDQHTVALKSNGTLWAWGANTAGQLGLGNLTQQNEPMPVGTATNWAAITAKGNSTLARKTGGALWAWGANNTGQLGLGDTATRLEPVRVGTDANWAAVAVGNSFTLALKEDGSFWGWGNNYAGQLGMRSYYFDAPQTVPTW